MPRLAAHHVGPKSRFPDRDATAPSELVTRLSVERSLLPAGDGRDRGCRGCDGRFLIAGFFLLLLVLAFAAFLRLLQQATGVR
jgi:hypothetical protein